MFAHALTATAVLGFWYLCGVLLYVVPKHEAIFKSLNAKLPYLTVLTLQASAFLQAYGILVLLFGTLGIVAACIIVRGINNTLGALLSAVACVIMALGIWSCYAAIRLPLAGMDTRLQ